MAVKEYRKKTSYTGPPVSEEPCDQTHPVSSGVDPTCGCIPGIPNFINTFTIVTSVNGMTGDVVVDTDQTYIHNQTVASAVWTIHHGLHRYPSVTVVDSAGSVVIGDVSYLSDETVVLYFQGAFSGIAYLN